VVDAQDSRHHATSLNSQNVLADQATCRDPCFQFAHENGKPYTSSNNGRDKQSMCDPPGICPRYSLSSLEGALGLDLTQLGALRQRLRRTRRPAEERSDRH
jgi:hypothetical protein